ncbi:FAD-binding protein [Lachnospiraceae bacterium ZAX-1]
MKYHLILNACFEDIKKQAQELQFFIDKYATNLEAGNTIIIFERGMEVAYLEQYAITQDLIFLEIQYYTPENALEQLAKILKNTDLIIFGSGHTHAELVVRVAERIRGNSLQNVHELEFKADGLHLKKKVYSSFMEAEFLVREKGVCIAISKGLGEKEMKQWPHNSCIVSLEQEGMERAHNSRIVSSEQEGMERARNSRIVSLEQEEMERAYHKNMISSEQEGMGQAHNLTENYIVSRTVTEEPDAQTIEDAKILLIAGQGIKEKEQVKKLEQLAQQMKGECGVSRPIAMHSWASMKQLVGVSGAMARPKLCIAFGVSGAPAFFAGIEKSHAIIAVNTDKNAPIMKKADAYIVEDCQRAIDELMNIMDCMKH